MIQSFAIKQNPNLTTNKTEYQKQFDLLIAIRDKLSITHDAINQILDIKKEVEESLENLKDQKAKKYINEFGKKLNTELTTVLNELVELRYTGFDDQTLIYPLKLNNRIASLQRSAGTDTKPTDQCYANFKELSAELAIHLEKLTIIMKKDVSAFRGLLKNK